MTDLQIRCMRNRYRLGAAAGDATRLSLDQLVARRLPVLLEGGIERLQARLGLSDEYQIALRRLNLRIRLASLPSSDACALAEDQAERLAEAWSQALLEGLQRVLLSAGWQAGRSLVSDLLAIFPDLEAARLAHWRQLARGGPPAWWVDSLLGAEAAGRDLTTTVMVLAQTDPAAAAAGILALTGADGPAWLGRIAVAQRRDIALRLVDPARAAGARGRAEVSATAAFGAEPMPFETLPSAQRELLRRCDDAASAALLYCAFMRVAEGVLRVDFDSLLRAASAWLAAPAATASDRPAAEDFATGAGEVKGGAVDPARLPADANPADAGPMNAAPAPSLTPAGADEDTRRLAADAPAPFAESLPVGCGGLLFLIRFALQHCEAGARIDQQMLALAKRVLGGLFEPLAPAARRAAWRRDAPLLMVFAGLQAPIEEVDAVDHPAAAQRWAATVEAAIAERIDADLAAAPKAAEYVLGRAAPDLSPLQRMLLRPGQLHTSTSEARLILPIAAIDIGLRRGGWDIDPGWVPQLGRIIRFEYRDR